MALASGTRLGPYEILEHTGDSATGEVYKASDTRLNRTVAVKVLPAHFSSSSEMRERFEREARTIASLSHPNICTLHDIGKEGDYDFLVIEHLEGETLAERLKRGALPMHEALKMAAEIADALDRAHSQGVAHRDLNPSNIMLTPSGAKLLDFGLATLTTPSEAGVSDSMAPTRAEPTRALSGPVDYMAPEQVEGKAGDARSDIFALGVIFYEAATGKKTFEGKTKTILIASILTGDPDPMPETPSALEHTIRRCLAKSPEDRWQTVHDFALQIQWISGGGEAAIPAAMASRQRKRERWMLAAAAALVVVTVGLAIPASRYFRAAAPDAFELRVPMINVSPADIAISPNGQMIAGVVRPTTGAPLLYVRPPGAITSRRLAGTEDAAQPFWSPDSRYIAFVANGKLRKIEANGGPVQDITAAADFAGGAWSANGEGLGTIVFGSSKGLFRVSAEGGAASALTAVTPPENGHYWPEFLPDGVHYIYLAWSPDSTNRALFSASLDSSDKPAKLMAAESNAVYAPGYLLLHREATLFAQPFDAKGLKLTGDAVQVAGGVSFMASNGHGDFDVSQEGTLLYFQGVAGTVARGRGGTGQNQQLAWISRTGGVIAAVGDAATTGDFDVSPDGKLVAVTRQEAGDAGADIWLIDWQRAGVANPLTFDPADDINPVFSPDGTKVAFTTFRKGNADIYIKHIDGPAGSETPLVETPANEFVEDWSRDGYVVYVVEHDNGQDIDAVSVSGDGKPFHVVTGPFRKDEPQVSPDGKFLAYTAETGGAFQVWVTSFPKGDQPIQISKDGGGQPRWRHVDGKELYYRDPNTAGIIAVGIAITGGRIVPGRPEALSAGPMNTGVTVRDATRHQLSASADGKRFLLRVPRGSVANAQAGESAAAIVTQVYTPDTVGSVGLFRGGRGVGARAGTFPQDLGLTVVRRWTAALGKVSK